MKTLLAALLAAASCAPGAQAQTGLPVRAAPVAPVRTRDQAIAAATGAAPASEAAAAAVEAARAGRTVAGLRPNPVVQGQVENIAGSGPYRGLHSAESTIGVAVPIELGGKRGARIAVATAQLTRTELIATLNDVRTRIDRNIAPEVGIPVPITISAGVASTDETGYYWLDLVNAADAALYRAKRQGRDRIVCHRALIEWKHSRPAREAD